MSSSMPLRILGVHGVNNYQAGLGPGQAAEHVAGWWHQAALEGLGLHRSVSGVLNFEMAYYAHRLHRGTPQGDEDPGLLDPEVQELIVAWAMACGAPKQTTQGWLTAPARAAVEWVAERYGLERRLVRTMTAVFFREVHTYFTDSERRALAVTDVAEAVRCAKPRIIIAHSLGSAVAYEALWAHPHPSVELLLTVGSPLAMPGIFFDRLAEHPGPRRRPPGVAKWINIADPGDFVAVPKGGIMARFHEVTADLIDAVGAFSFHQVAKYLRCGATAGVLANYVQSHPP